MAKRNPLPAEIQNHTADDVTLLTNDNKPALTKIDGAKLLDTITATLKRFLVLPEHAAETLALWALFTHAFDAWWYSPRLILTSPGPESGKTRTLEIVEKLCAGGTRADFATEAGVRRKIAENQHKPFTLLLDEADTFFADKPQLRSALNSGWKRGGKALLTKTNSEQQIVSDELSLWAPVAIAGIGERWLWKALRTRSFVFKLQKKRRDETVEDWDTLAAHSEVGNLGRRIAQWGRESVAALKAAQPDMPSELHNRQRDNWKPLITIADQAGGEWPMRARRIALALSGLKPELEGGPRLLAVIRDVFNERQADRIKSKDLVAALQKRGNLEIASENTLADAMKGFDIQPKQIKFGKVGLKGYRRTQFEDAWSRWLDD